MRLIATLVAGLAAGGLAAGCTAGAEDVQPDPLQLYFPTGAAISPDGTRLFVANANSDLTFDSGSITVVALPSVEAAIERWTVNRDPGACAQDPEFTETLVCDERVFLQETRDAGVRIGNFATEIAVQDLGGGRLRLVVPTRGDPSIAWIDWDPAAGRLSCERTGGGFALCDADHRLSFLFNDADNTAIREEPFGVFAATIPDSDPADGLDDSSGYAIVTHLSSGAVTLIDSPPNGAVQVTDVALNSFAPDPFTGVPGATGVAGRRPGTAENIVYVGSRSEDRIQMFTVGRPVNGAPPFLLTGDWFFLNDVGYPNPNNPNTGSNDTRGMVFSQGGDRLYLVNRKPPTLQIYDTSLDATGFPMNRAVGATDICRQASTVSVAGTEDGERVFVSCFQDGQIYVIDPRGTGRIEDIITVGRGPYTVVASPDGRRLFVTNFLEDTIAVIDLVPGSATRNRVVLRIGEPRLL